MTLFEVIFVARCFDSFFFFHFFVIIIISNDDDVDVEGGVGPNKKLIQELDVKIIFTRAA